MKKRPTAVSSKFLKSIEARYKKKGRRRYRRRRRRKPLFLPYSSLKLVGVSVRRDDNLLKQPNKLVVSLWERLFIYLKIQLKENVSIDGVRDDGRSLRAYVFFLEEQQRGEAPKRRGGCSAAENAKRSTDFISQVETTAAAKSAILKVVF